MSAGLFTVPGEGPFPFVQSTYKHVRSFTTPSSPAVANTVTFTYEDQLQASQQLSVGAGWAGMVWADMCNAPASQTQNIVKYFLTGPVLT